MSDIIGGDVEIVARRMSAERLAVKRAHAARHPEGRTAELMAHIEAQAEVIQRLYDKQEADNAQWNRLLAQHVDIESDLRDKVQAQTQTIREACGHIEALLQFLYHEETDGIENMVGGWARAWLAAHKETQNETD